MDQETLKNSPAPEVIDLRGDTTMPPEEAPDGSDDERHGVQLTTRQLVDVFSRLVGGAKYPKPEQAHDRAAFIVQYQAIVGSICEDFLDLDSALPAITAPQSLPPWARLLLGGVVLIGGAIAIEPTGFKGENLQKAGTAIRERIRGVFSRSKEADHGSDHRVESSGNRPRIYPVPENGGASDA